MLSKKFNVYIEKLKKDKTKAIALMGSFARGDEKKYSDVDIVCFTDKKEEKEPIIKIIDDRYVVVSFVNEKEVNHSFTNPSQISAFIQGLQIAKILWDPNKYLEKLQEKAKKFKWNKAIQEKANRHVSKELVGWVEEALKAVQGAKHNDVGRMLSGLFGLSHGMLNILRIQKGVLLKGENTTFEQVTEKIKDNPKLVLLLNVVFCTREKLSLKEQTVAGLKCFLVVTDYLDNIIQKQDRIVIDYARGVIKKELKNL